MDNDNVVALHPVLEMWTLKTVLGVTAVFGRVVMDPTGERKPYDYILVKDVENIEFGEDFNTLYTAKGIYLLKGGPK